MNVVCTVQTPRGPCKQMDLSTLKHLLVGWIAECIVQCCCSSLRVHCSNKFFSRADKWLLAACYAFAPARHEYWFLHQVKTWRWSRWWIHRDYLMSRHFEPQNGREVPSSTSRNSWGVKCHKWLLYHHLWLPQSFLFEGSVCGSIWLKIGLICLLWCGQRGSTVLHSVCIRRSLIVRT